MRQRAQVWVPNIENVLQQVDTIMEPHREYWTEPDEEGNYDAVGFWDYWQLGVRSPVVDDLLGLHEELDGDVEELDITPVGDVRDDTRVQTLVIGDTVLYAENVDGDPLKPALDRLGIVDGYLVAVIYHC